MPRIVVMKEGCLAVEALVEIVPRVGEMFTVGKVYQDPFFLDLAGQRLTAIARLDPRKLRYANEKGIDTCQMAECFAIGQEPQDVVCQVGRRLGLFWELVSSWGSTRHFYSLIEVGEESIPVTVATDRSSSWLSLSIRKPSIKPWQKGAFDRTEKYVETWLAKLGEAFALALGSKHERRSDETPPYIFLEWPRVPQIRIF